ncbi:hypothetical protein F5B19DRAFT_448205 [Rostrohypoxylon terebratum]|nr:hypothetical protein F5B19DRAFT_448205 [Rostrohypoxylon terebratum]
MSPLINGDKLEYARLPSLDGSTSLDLTVQQREINWRRRFYYLLVSSLVVLSLVTGGVLYAMNQNSCPVLTPGAETPYSPAPLTYNNRYLTSDPDTPKFMGKPRPEMDQAWHDLLAGTMIRYSREELKLANNATSVEHIDGGFVGGLGISHSLHCLKRLKQYLHPEYYYSHEEQNWDELYSHVDHCLESLRQELMCNADINVYTLEWTPHSRFKPAVRVPQPHACVDWISLHSWMKERAARSVDMVGPPESLYKGKESLATA